MKLASSRPLHRIDGDGPRKGRETGHGLEAARRHRGDVDRREDRADGHVRCQQGATGREAQQDGQDRRRELALVAVVGLSLTLILDIDKLVDADNPAATVSQGRNSLDRAAAAALEQIREAESLAQQSPGVSDSTTPPLMVEQIKPGNITRDDNPQCNVTQRATTALWWQCIQSLERRGYAEAATIEYEALFAAYPVFEVP